MRRQVDTGLDRSRRITDLEHRTADLARQLTEARISLELELAQAAGRRDLSHGQVRTTAETAGPDGDSADDARISGSQPRAADAAWLGAPPGGQEALSAQQRTEILVLRGRPSAHRRGLSQRSMVAVGAGFVGVLITIGVLVLSGSGASWPVSVPAVQSEAVKACQNPNIKSEPDQVNFACAKATQQILWVFALITSSGNPNFADKRTGRIGLEPITPAQGGEVAWSLNLHHPYDPANPIDSLEVAARAINNIIGGATLTGADGHAVVQPGLESSAANCRRYTGSAALTSRAGFPSLCARPVTSSAGQAALVADVFRRWELRARPTAARDAAVLFANAKNPAAAQVQAILKLLPDPKLLG
jgi:hypothetical protein